MGTIVQEYIVSHRREDSLIVCIYFLAFGLSWCFAFIIATRNHMCLVRFAVPTAGCCTAWVVLTISFGRLCCHGGTPVFHAADPSPPPGPEFGVREVMDAGPVRRSLPPPRSANSGQTPSDPVALPEDVLVHERMSLRDDDDPGSDDSLGIGPDSDPPTDPPLQHADRVSHRFDEFLSTVFVQVRARPPP
jgi:hypothetical protein